MDKPDPARDATGTGRAAASGGRRQRCSRRHPRRPRCDRQPARAVSVSASAPGCVRLSPLRRRLPLTRCRPALCAGTTRPASGSACTPALLMALCLRRPRPRRHTAASPAPQQPAGLGRTKRAARPRPARCSPTSAWTTPRRGTSPARPSRSAAGARRSARRALRRRLLPEATRRRPASRRKHRRTPTRARLESTPRWHDSG
jgi:hypothetical protein